MTDTPADTKALEVTASMQWEIVAEFGKFDIRRIADWYLLACWCVTTEGTHGR